MNATVYRDTQAVIFVSSYDEEKSLDELTSTWTGRLKGYLNPDEYCSIIAINKYDLDEASRQVTQESIEQKAQDMNCEFVNVSAKDNINIDLLFTKVVELLEKKFPGPAGGVNVNINDNPGTGGGGGKCKC